MAETYSTTYALRPAAGAAGDLFLPSDGFTLERDSGVAWVPWGPTFPFVAPVDGDYSWVNQGTATVTTANCGIFLNAPAVAGVQVRARVKAAPATPYTVTAGIMQMNHGGNVNTLNVGLLWRQSSDGKLAVFHLYPQWMSSAKFTNSTTYTAQYASQQVSLRPKLWWLRIADDGANRICSWSLDGRHWIAFHTVGRTDFLTADQVGFFALSNSAGVPAGLMLASWQEA